MSSRTFAAAVLIACLPFAPRPLAQDERTPAAEGERTITGRIVLPPRTPEDERVEVVLEAFKGDERWYGMERFGPEAWEERGRAALDEEGRFEVRGKGAEHLQVRLDARYVFPKERLEVGEGDDLGLIELELGGEIVFELKPPEGTKHDVGVLRGMPLTVMYTPAQGMFSGSPPTMPGRITDRLEVVLGGLSRKYNYELEADIAPFAPLRESARPVPGESLRVPVQLQEGLAVAGRVVDDEGKPVPGAQVQAATGPEPGTHYDYAETDEAGAFTFAALDPRLKAMKVSKQGYVTRRLEGSELEKPGDLAVVLSSGSSISGSVRLADGRPVQGCAIYVPKDHGKLAETKSDAQGRFELSGIDADEVKLVAEARLDEQSLAAEGVVRVPARTWRLPPWRLELDVRAGARGLELVLPEPPGLAGVVVDDLGRPVLTFQLGASRRGSESSRLFGRDPRFGSSDEEMHCDTDDGTFEWKALTAGEWTVWAESREHAPGELVRVGLPGSGPVRLVLPRGARIVGRVVDASGQPVERAYVQTIAGSMIHGNLAVTTDAEGRFELTGLTAGQVELRVRAKGHAQTEKPTFMLETGQEVEDVLLRLGRGGTILCTVYDAEGRPEKLASVSMFSAGGGLQKRAESDAAGVARFEDVEPGEYVLTMFLQYDSSESRTLSTRVTVMEGATARCELGRDTRTRPVVVRGELTSGGRPLVGYVVFAASEARREESARATTDEGGVFELGLPAGGPAYFRVTPVLSGRQVGFERTLPESGRADVRFDLPTATIRGRITGYGEAFKFITATLRRAADGSSWSGGDVSFVGVAEDGTFTCRHLTAGRYDVSVMPTPRMSLRLDDESSGYASTTVELAAGEEADIVLEWRAGGTIEGSLKDERGNPIANAAVFASRPDGRPLHPVGAMAFDGRFTLSGLPSGAVRIEAFGPHRLVSGPVEVVLTEGEVTHRDLVLSTGSILRISFAEAQPEGTVLSVRDAKGVEHAATRGPDAAGFHNPGTKQRTVGPLPPGEYVVRVVRPGGDTVERRVTVKGEEELVLDLSQ